MDLVVDRGGVPSLRQVSQRQLKRDLYTILHPILDADSFSDVYFVEDGGECVLHHINGKDSDQRLSNLAILPNRQGNVGRHTHDFLHSLNRLLQDFQKSSVEDLYNTRVALNVLDTYESGKPCFYKLGDLVQHLSGGNKLESLQIVANSLLESYERSNEGVLTEATRQELIAQSKKGRPTKTYGTSRFVRRTKSRINPSSKNYNQIDMNALFKGGLLSFKVPVHGETNEYEVELLFDNFLEELQKQTKQEKKPCEYKTVAQALMRAYNRDDTYISCSCPDFKYRFAYHATKGRYNAGKPELRPSDITNPRNDLGAGCKHTMLVLSNLRWAMKVATVINNYIKYMEKNMPKLYADVIFPAVYGMSYNKATQLGLFDDEEAELINTMDNEEQSQELDKINQERATSGQFKKDQPGINNQIKWTKKEPENVELDLEVEEE